MANNPAGSIVEELFKSMVSKHELVGEDAKHEHGEIEAGDVEIDTGMEDGVDVDNAEETDDSFKLKVPDVKVDDNLDLAKKTPAVIRAKDSTPESMPKASNTMTKKPLSPGGKFPPAQDNQSKVAGPNPPTPIETGQRMPTAEKPNIPHPDDNTLENPYDKKKKNPFAKALTPADLVEEVYKASTMEEVAIPEEKSWSSGWLGQSAEAEHYAHALRFYEVRAMPGTPRNGLSALVIHSDDLGKARSAASVAGVPGYWLSTQKALFNEADLLLRAQQYELDDMPSFIDIDDDDEMGEGEPDEDNILAVGSPQDGMTVIQTPDGTLVGQLSAGDGEAVAKVEARRRLGLFAVAAATAAALKSETVGDGDEVVDEVLKAGTSEGAKRGWEARRHGMGHKYEEHPNFDPNRNSGGQPDNGKNKVVHQHEGIYGFKKPIPVHEVNDWSTLPEGQSEGHKPTGDTGADWRSAYKHNTRNSRHIYTSDGKLHAAQNFGQEAPAGHDVQGWVHDHDKTVELASPAHYGDSNKVRQAAVDKLKATVNRLHSVGLPKDYEINVDLGDQIGTRSAEHAYHLLQGGRLPSGARRQGMSGKRATELDDDYGGGVGAHDRYRASLQRLHGKSTAEFVADAYKAGTSEEQ